MRLTTKEIQTIARKITNPIVIFDLETTGIDKQEDEIVQFYGLRIEPSGMNKSLEFKCKPKKLIPKEASDIHGITNEMVADEPPFNYYVPDLLSLFDKADIGGYNVFGFDLPIINRQLSEYGKRGVFKNANVLDSFTLARKHHPRDLSTMLAIYTGEEMENAHDASSDVIATAKILSAQIEIESDNEYLKICEMTTPPPSERVGLTDQIKFVNGEPVFNFGKHKGERLIDNINYCEWILRQDFDYEIKEFITDLLRS